MHQAEWNKHLKRLLLSGYFQAIYTPAIGCNGAPRENSDQDYGICFTDQLNRTADAQ